MVSRAACLQQGHLTSPLQLWLQRSWQSAGLYFPPDTSAPTWSCQLPRPGSSPPSPAPAPSGLGHYAPEGCLPGSCPASASRNSDRYSCPAQHEEKPFSPQFPGTYKVIPFDGGRWKSQAKPLSLQENRWVDHMCNAAHAFPDHADRRKELAATLMCRDFLGYPKPREKVGKKAGRKGSNEALKGIFLTGTSCPWLGSA